MRASETSASSPIRQPRRDDCSRTKLRSTTRAARAALCIGTRLSDRRGEHQEPGLRNARVAQARDCESKGFRARSSRRLTPCPGRAYAPPRVWRAARRFCWSSEAGVSFDVARGDRICLLAAVPTALQVTLAGTTSRSLPCAPVDSEVAPPGQYAWIAPAGPGGRGIKSCLAGSGRAHHRDLRPAAGELPFWSEESPRVAERHAVTHSDPVARIRDSGLTVSTCSRSAVGAASPLGCSCGDPADRTRPGIG
jgi:hypothetical protein